MNRYDFEAWRHWGIVDAQLASHPYTGEQGHVSAERKAGRLITPVMNR